LRGRVEVRSREGSVEIRQSHGFVSAQSESGPIDVEMRTWRFLDRAFFETVDGNIRLTLPSVFSAEAELRSLRGEVQVEFPVQSLEAQGVYGPSPKNYLHGKIGDG